MQLVIGHFAESVTVFTGDSGGPSSVIRVLGSDLPSTRTLRNRYARGFVLQPLPLKEVIAADVVVADLNPRMPMVWLVTATRRVLRRPTVLWGHAWPRAGRAARSDLVRGVLRRLATGLITYTQTQADELRLLHPGKAVTAAPNAICLRSECEFNGTSRRDSVSYVGRLVPQKKPLLLIDAFDLVAPRVPDLKLMVVGDGPLQEDVARRAARSPCSDRIELLGHVGDRERLREVYDRSIVSVSPGYAGLALTQSFSFGVPMLISRDEPHAPEVEAARQGFNAADFETDDASDLAEALARFAADRTAWHARGSSIAQDCADTYTAEAMAAGVIEAVEAAR